MKPYFDIDKSLKECPPEKIFKYINGYRWVKRIVVRHDSIVARPEMQIREHLVKQENAAEISQSFKAIGWRHDKPPIVATVLEENKNLFDLKWGFTRHQSASMVHWETIIIDVVEPIGSPLDQYTNRYTSNDHPGEAFTPNTKEDIYNGAIGAVELGLIKPDDDSVKAWILRASSTKTPEEREKIFKSYKKRMPATGPVRTWHNQRGVNSIHQYATKNNLPYKGDAGLEASGKLAYVTWYKNLRSTIADAKHTFLQYGGKLPVNIIGYISEPKAAPALYNQRELWLKRAEKDRKEEAEWIQHISQLCGANLDVDKIDEVLQNQALCFGTFMWQDNTPNPDLSGEPTESGIVDINGNKATLK
jgi:hypothetical protein